MEYDILVSMYRKKEDLGFIHDRPNGTERYVFIHFINPVRIRLYNRMITTMPHACIIFSPDEPCYYEASTFEILHDWSCFLPTEEKYNPQNLGLPINKLFYTDKGHEITKIVEIINWLSYMYRTEDMSAELLKLLKMLADEQQLHHKNMVYNDSIDRFNNLRMLMYENPKNWDIGKMATYINLSRSRFSVKYKTLFGISAIDDLSNATICLAQKLLSTTNLTCQNIATECGYESVPFFIQKFKKSTGFTPNKWRESIKAEEAKTTSEQK